MATSPRIDAIETPTTQTDVLATKAGQKAYVHGITYNGSIAPTISGPAGLTVLGSAFIPYQMQDGSWRMRFNFDVTHSSLTVLDFTINGVTFSAFQNAISGYAGAGIVVSGRTNSSAGTMIARAGTAGTASSWSGDVTLTSKPTWAY